jgi:hypothetical protein
VGDYLNFTGNNSHCAHIYNVTGTSYLQFDRCIFTIVSRSGNEYEIRGLNVADTDPTVVVRNCLAYDFIESAGGGSAGFYGPGDTAVIYSYNNTAVNCYHGYDAGDSVMTLKNCLFYSQGLSGATGYYLRSGSWGTGTDYNASDLSSDAPGSNSRNEQTFSFVAEGSDNFHLASDDTGALGYGTDLSGETYPVTEDIDGESRSWWDIGADEYQRPAAGGDVGLLPQHRLVMTDLF